MRQNPGLKPEKERPDEEEVHRRTDDRSRQKARSWSVSARICPLLGLSVSTASYKERVSADEPVADKLKELADKHKCKAFFCSDF